MARIGIVGGTFDPIHTGHLIIGNEVREALDLEGIWFMPNKIPPHKETVPTAKEHRLAMIQLAIADNPYFHLVTDELERDGASYTYETMLMLKEKYPKHTFYFIIGGDMVEYLPKWYKVDELVELVQFVGVTRPKFTLETPYPIEKVETPELAISSTMIRERRKSKRTIKYLVPREVQNYIEERGLYE